MSFKEKEEYQFCYSQEESVIPFQTLFDTQQKYRELIDELLKETYPDYHIQFKAKPAESGSYIFNQVVELYLDSGIQIVSIASGLAGFIGGVASLIAAVSQSNGKKADSEITIENFTQLNINNSTINVPTEIWDAYKRNGKIGFKIKEFGKSLVEDKAVEEVKVTQSDTKEEILNIPKKNFRALTKDSPYIDKDPRHEEDDVLLYIFKLVLAPKKNSRWSFIYKDRKINSVKIKDESFIRRVNERREVFGNGDALRVRLRTTKEYDEAFGMHLVKETGYEILNVYEHISSGSDQLNLDL